jgi:dethiobiotin synthetase
MPDLLVTGTDTGVGKTVVTAALLLALRERGVRAVAFKPVETGLEAGTESDSEILIKASGFDHPLARPLLRLSEPLAPAVAAERAGQVLRPSSIEERVRALRADGYRVVVEGAGGLLVPLAWGYSPLDLAEQLGLEAVVVARAGLGTLNHTCLTVDALQARGVPVRAVVLNGIGHPPSLAEETNPEALRRLRPGLRLLAIPRHAAPDALLAAYASVPLIVTLL